MEAEQSTAAIRIQLKHRFLSENFNLLVAVLKNLRIEGFKLENLKKTVNMVKGIFFISYIRSIRSSLL